MAGPRTRHSPCWNPPPAGENELAGAAPNEGSGTLTPISVVSHAPTPVLAIAPTAILSWDNKLFKQFMKA